MGQLIQAQAFCNNEVAYLAWKADKRITGCLGFMIARIHLDGAGKEVDRRILPAWVAFTTQSNPEWEEQDTSVWPVQKFSWRDLTLRRSRDSKEVRTSDFQVKYEITPVGLAGRGRTPVPTSPTARPGQYTGKPIPLFVCGRPIQTNVITVSNRCGDTSVAFTNGILSTQNLRKQLGAKKGKLPSKAVLEEHLAKPGDSIREFLAGDVLTTLRSLFERARQEDAKLYLALYELSDPELIALLKEHQARIELILCTAGSTPPKKGSGDKTTWDTTNQAARAELKKLMKKRLHDRWFNNSAHIGHNKFAVLVGKDGTPKAVYSGSTNWTQTGLCAQTNNTIVIESRKVAQAYLDYWTRLRDDKLPTPEPETAQLTCNQGAALRKADAKSNKATLDRGKTNIELWFSPNTPDLKDSQTRTVPPDLEVVFRLMKQAKQAILFLVFNPGRTKAEGDDINTVVAAGVNFGRLDSSLYVSGAISDPTAMPGYTPAKKDGETDETDETEKAPLPAIFTPGGAPNVLVIRAAAVKDLIGDFQKELLTIGHAIIHDKIVVIDPMSKTDCVVVTGSHNLGFKASYANDENMMIIRGNQPLALAYAAHVLDVYDHYKFRAVLEQQRRDEMLGKTTPRPKKTNQGFLSTKDTWQDPYFDGRKGNEPQYFLSAKL
jgi:phosphatidylserine/phosphatidylglycerophosphate/cardiolipin synthase-like enzyme